MERHPSSRAKPWSSGMAARFSFRENMKSGTLVLSSLAAMYIFLVPKVPASSLADADVQEYLGRPSVQQRSTPHGVTILNSSYQLIQAIKLPNGGCRFKTSETASSGEV